MVLPTSGKKITFALNFLGLAFVFFEKRLNNGNN
jgi:hypothetical protein